MTTSICIYKYLHICHLIRMVLCMHCNNTLIHFIHIRI